MALTGKKRSLTIEVTKTLADELVIGYPRKYYGTQMFAYNGVEYPTISAEKLTTMPVAQYQARLNAFIAYVQTQEMGLIISEVQTNEPYSDSVQQIKP